MKALIKAIRMHIKNQKLKHKKFAKIKNKTLLKKGKVQLNLNDGSNIRVDKDNYNVGDVLVLDLKSNVLGIIKMDKGINVLLIAGKHAGKTGKVKEFDNNNIIIESGKEEIKTLRKYAFAFDDGKQGIKIN